LAPEAVATGFGSAWVAEVLGDRILRFSPEGELLTEIPVGNTPVDVATGQGSVWVVHTRSDPKHYGKGDASLLKIDPTTGEPGKAVPAGTCPHSVTTGGSAVWVLDFCDEVVRKFDPEALQPLGIVDLPAAADARAVGDGFLWTVHPEDGVVLRTDLEELTQVGDPIRLEDSRGFRPSAVTYGAGSIWVSAGGLFRLVVQ
jgi:streptogramin lyase